MRGSGIYIATMLRRVLLALLALCLALPAIGMPAAAQTPAGGHEMASGPCHDGAKREFPLSSHSAARHDCIGCAAPSVPPVVAARGRVPRSLPAADTVAAPLLGEAIRPALPPPRA